MGLISIDLKSYIKTRKKAQPIYTLGWAARLRFSINKNTCPIPQLFFHLLFLEQEPKPRALYLAMATLDSDVPMVPVGEASSSAGPSSSRKNKRFEIKKWNAVALWAWGTSSFPNPNPSFLSFFLHYFVTICAFVYVLCVYLGFLIFFRVFDD